MTINWITLAGEISQIAEEDYFEFQLDAYDTSGSALTYQVIAGTLGDGLQLYRTGLIQGIPVVSNVTAQNTYTQSFTVRVTNVRGEISDRTFSIVINSIVLPQIVPRNVSLGTIYDGFHWIYQLEATDPSPSAILSWSVIAGSLPLGVTLNATTGLLSGYVLPYVSPANSVTLGWDNSRWDSLIWDTPTAVAQSITYQFTIQVFDGSRYDESKYTLEVLAKELLTVDNEQILADVDTITIDTDNRHAPIILTLPSTLPTQRQNSNFAFKIDGVDIDGGAVNFAIQSYNAEEFDQGGVAGFDDFGFDQADQSVPFGLTIDPVTGWITGVLGSQVEVQKTYTFQVYCYKVDNHSYVSDPVTFTLTVLGDLNNVIDWITPTDLGVMDNGVISELSIQANARLPGKKLHFTLTPGTPDFTNVDPASEIINYSSAPFSRLPQGLKLLDNGLIVGRTTFEYFSMDGNKTTFDKVSTKFDNIYIFSVTTSDETQFELDAGTTTIDVEITGSTTSFDALYQNDHVLGASVLRKNATVSDTRTFMIRITNDNASPYENLYLRALPDATRRTTFRNIIENQDYFPDNLIYRYDDPYYGKARDIKFLFAAGLAPSTASTYIASMQHNQYTKRIELGQVKTAHALDANFNIKYELVYVEVVDTSTNNGLSAPNTIVAPLSTTPFTAIYPDSLDNMKSEISQIGVINQAALPTWMTDPQSTGRVLGFTRAVVLAYTVPGASSLIAFRLNQENINFGDLEFVVDRYQLDNNMSTNYDIADRKFNLSKETTFDRFPPAGGMHPFAGAVDFAVTIPFDEINGRTTSYILQNGGLDGSSTIVSGQQIVFARQELYAELLTNQQSSYTDTFDNDRFDSTGFNLSVIPRIYSSPNNGWNENNGLYGTDTYGNTVYAQTSSIPGFLESIIDPGIVNEQGGIWEVSISSDSVVTLVFVKPVLFNEYVTVGGGDSYGHTQIYYDPIIKPGHSVPDYSILSQASFVVGKTTRFDGNGTRFFNNKDQYSAPETNNIFIKFPKTSMYQ